MEFIIDLETGIRKSCEEGNILMTRSYLEELVSLSESPSEVINQAVELGIIKRHISVTHRERTLYSLKAKHLDAEILKWSIFALERSEVIPFTSRIQEVLDTVFSLTTTKEELFKVFRELNKRKYTRQLPNGSIEKVLHFSDPFNYKITRISPILYNEFYKTESVFSSDIQGVYVRSVYYHSFGLMPVHMSFSDIYKCVERSEDRRTVHMKAPRLKALISYIIMKNGVVPIKKLRLALVVLLKSIQVPGFDSFYEFVKGQPEFAIDEKAEDEDCPICLEDMKYSGFPLSCKHWFHSKCLKKMISVRQKLFYQGCPICRHAIKDEEIKEIYKSPDDKHTLITDELLVSMNKNNPERFMLAVKLSNNLETQIKSSLDTILNNNLIFEDCYHLKEQLGKCSSCSFIIHFNPQFKTVSCNVCGTWYCTKCSKVVCTCFYN